MVSALILGSLLVAAAPAEGISDLDLKTYQDAKATAGRDPEAHIRLALWCEKHGLDAERIKHLAIVVLADPKNATARGLLGLVSFKGQWQRPENVAQKVQSDAELAATLAEYNAKREKAPRTADAQWQLALWCEQKGLTAEATAHLATVTRLDPKREDAWKHLGYKKHNGRWVTDSQLSAEKAEAEAQKKADRRWMPILDKWREGLAKKDKQEEIQQAVASVTDPRAVASIMRTFAVGSASEQTIAVQLLGQIQSPAASRGLALLSVLSPAAEVRRVAVETLKRRDAREFVGLLIAQLRDPIKYEVKPVNGVNSPGVLRIEGKQFNLERVFAVQETFQETRFSRTLARYIQESNAFNTSNNFGGADWTEANSFSAYTPLFGAGATGFNPVTEKTLAPLVADFQTRLGTAQQMLANQVNAIEGYNASVRKVNPQSAMALEEVTGQDLKEDSEAWKKWWTNDQGYYYQAVDQSQAATRPTISELYLAAPRHSCFGAGTPVRTRDGSPAIETLRVGDQVLTQDTQTGALSFKPVMAVYHNKPAPTLRITVGNESIVATGIHRFWRAGKGWAMARDLKPGDTIRLIGGVGKVASVESEAEQPVFNLEVGEDQSYFVGNLGALVHDNSLVQPALHPFDAEPSLAAVKAGGSD